MQVKALKLSNFRGFEALTMRFHEELTVLVGVNGSGKTSVLDALARSVVRTGGTGGGIAQSEISFGHDSAEIQVDYDTDLGDPGPDLRTRTWSTNARSGTDTVVRSSGVAARWRTRTRPVPLVLYLPVGRRAQDATPSSTDARFWAPHTAWEDAPATEFTALFHWFREREDLENQDRRESPVHRDPQLSAVRTAIERSMTGCSNPRVRRPRGEQREVFKKPVLVVDKAGVEMAFDQLSEGERILVAMVADVARRMCIANDSSPLEGNGVVLIDEIELHLHPKWQAEIIPALRRTFPNLQFIVTTHSPIVLSRVPAECIRVLEDFKVYDAPGKTEGRDPNALLLEVFDTPLRPEDVTAQLRAIGDLIDADNLEGAREALDALAESLGERDSEVTRLRTMLSVLAS